MNQITALISLYSEIIAFLVAASVISLFIGWMINRSSAKRHLNSTIEGWEKRYYALEETSRSDTENLEEQLQTLAGENKTQRNTNRVLTDSLKKNESSIQKARAESIELNRQHAETQERLQRIIQQKDREIAELGNRLNHNTGKQTSLGSTHIAPNISGTDAAKSRRLHDTDLNHADTVAINPHEPFDATVQMSAQDLRNKSVFDDPPTAQTPDGTFEDTADLSAMVMDDMEESTVALDDEALAFAQHSVPSRHGK